MKKILIAGGGASGMAAAISAAASGASVVLLEAREQTGKKLLRTGGGRCNFTNEFMDPSCYYGDPDFIRSFLERFSTKDCLDFFKGLGLLYRERDGYYYPYSNSAASVLSVLNAGMKAASCSVYLNSPVTKTRVLPEGSFEVFSGGQTFRGDALILSAGSAAGNDARGFSVSSFLPEKVKLPMRPFQPALTMLYGSDGVERAWEGVRCRGSVTLGARKETGELQLLSAGISGIPVFQISRNAVRMLSRNEKVLVSLDFLPDFTEDTVDQLIAHAGEKELEGLLRGWLPRKLIPVILRRAGLFADRSASGLSEMERSALIRALKAFSYHVTGHGDFKDAQTVSGGVDPACLTENFEAAGVPGLYLTGELVDIDGICGGYNLHFAFGSGILAGSAAARTVTGVS